MVMLVFNLCQMVLCRSISAGTYQGCYIVTSILICHERSNKEHYSLMLVLNQVKQEMLLGHIFLNLSDEELRTSQRLRYGMVLYRYIVILPRRSYLMLHSFGAISDRSMSTHLIRKGSYMPHYC